MSDDETMQDVRDDINEFADIEQDHSHAGWFNNDELRGLARACAELKDRRRALREDSDA